VALARLLGLLDPDGPGSFTHPHASRMLYADGKVITPVFTGKPGETRIDRRTRQAVGVRHDPDAHLHIEGGRVEAYGTKFVVVATRSKRDRVILDVRHVPYQGSGGEAGIAMESFADLVPLAPGVLGVVYDMALRGAHLDRMMREFGWLGITKVPAAEIHIRRGQRGGRRIPKERLVETKDLKMPDGTTTTITLYARDGALGMGVLTDEGEMVFQAMARVRTQRKVGKKYPFRWYNQYRLPEAYGGGEITVRLSGNAEDERRRFNRPENLRAIPPADPDFDRLYVLRSDAESINRSIEDTLYLGRAHSVGHVRQELDLLGFAILVNSLTLARNRARERLEAAA
jgi:hypothetical protein